jgi:hypothetical protein
MMRSRLVLAVYGAAASWLAVFAAYLVYLLLPFGVGLLSTLLAALVAIALLVWLVRRLVWRPLRRGPIGRWRLAAVLPLAAATVTLDVLRTHYIIPLRRADQDDCSFGSISAEQYRAMAQALNRKLDPNWARILDENYARAETLEAELAAQLPRRADQGALIGRIHALARSIGADYSHVFGSNKLYYQYKLDLNRTWNARRALLRWVVLDFVASRPVNGEQVFFLGVHVRLPTFKGSEASDAPPRSRSCPPVPSDV